ncbi:MAG: tetratricopeptide repeat protein [Vicinamibacterales bacterium]
MADSPRIDELRRRVERDPSSIAFAQLAEEHRRIGNFAEAVAVARTGLARHPAYLSARVTLGRALLELEQYEEAQRELETVLRASPDNLAAIRALATLHQRQGELGDAARHYTTALEVSRMPFELPDLPPLPEFPELANLDLPVTATPALDEFTRTLEALDHITLDLPQPVSDIELSAIDENPAQAELEAWLEAIQLDRASR